MSTFTLAISCLTTSNLPWLMDVTFQVPVQYCSLQHWTLLLSPVTSTTGHCFCFGSIPSFFLELFLHWSPVAYCTPTWGVPLSVSYHFAFSYCSWGSQGKNTEVVCYSLLQWTTFCQISPPWPVRLGWPHTAWLSFIVIRVAQVRSDQLLSRVRLFVTPWTAAHQVSLPSPTPGVCSNSCPFSQGCHLSTAFSVVPFSSCPQYLPASESFPMSQLFTWGGQSIGVSASASVLPGNSINVHHSWWIFGGFGQMYNDT